MRKQIPSVFGFMLIVLVFTSCGSDENKITSTLTINVTPDYAPDQDEAGYFFISDSLGTVLDTQEIKSGQDVKLSTNKALKKVHLTMCRLRKNTSQEFHTVSTFLNVPMNDAPIDFELLKPAGTIGSVKININNFTGSMYSTIFSNGFNNDKVYNDNVTSLTQNGNTLTAQLNLVEANSEIIINTYGSDLSYYSIKNVNANDNINIDFNDFSKYSKKLTTNLSGLSSGSIMGFKGKESRLGSVLSSISNVLSLPYLGYLDGYDNYLTQLTSYKQGYSIYYKKYGSLPSAINLPEAGLTVASRDFRTFDFKFTLPYTYRISVWEYSEPNSNNSFLWYVHGDSPSQKVTLPDEIVSKYNFLKAEKLEYAASSFIKCQGDCSYQGHVKEFFSGQRTNLEFYQHSF